MAQPTFLYCEYNSSSAVTVTDTYSPAGSYAGDNVLEPTEDLTHRFANATGTKSIVIDMIDTRTVGYVGLLGYGLDGITVEFRGSTDNFSASDVQLLAETTLSADANCAWEALTTTGDYRYVKVLLSSIPSDLEIAHVCCGDLVLLPYFTTDSSPYDLDVTGKHLVSAGGYYIGSTIERAMREMKIDFGSVTTVEFPDITAWADVCIKTMRPFFLVPDTAASDVFFGWVQKGNFTAPLKNSLRDISSLTFQTRAA